MSAWRWCGVLCCLFALFWFSACSEPQRTCKVPGDCLSGEACLNGFCATPDPGTEPVADVVKDARTEFIPEDKPEPRPEPQPEPQPEPKPEKPADRKPPNKCGLCPSSSFCDPAIGKCIPRLCGGCRAGSNDCGTGNLCLRTNANPPETFCGRDCSKDGKCPTGFRCFSINNGQFKQCAPTAVTCKAPIGIGAPCQGGKAGAPECPHHYPTCSTTKAGATGSCTKTCQSAADCPTGFRRCADRGDGTKVCLSGCLDKRDCPNERPNCVEENGVKQCKADPYTGPEVCGKGKANQQGVGKSCPNGDSDCGSGFCLGQKHSVIQPFCSKGCSSDSDCGQGAACLWTMVQGTRKQACLPRDCYCLEAPDLKGRDDLFSKALKAVGRDRCSLIYQKREFDLNPKDILFDPFRLPWFNRIHREPLEALRFSKATTARIDGALQKKGLASVTDTLAASAGWLGQNIQTTPVKLTVATSQPLASAVATLITAHGATPDKAVLEQQASKVPLALQKKLALVVLALSEAAKKRNEALPAPVKSNLNYYFQRAASVVLPSAQRFAFVKNGASTPEYWVLARDFGYKAMYRGAWLLAKAIEQADLKADPSYKGFSFHASTPLGRIILSDNANHTYDPTNASLKGDIALLVDTGGNDTYKIAAGANSSPNNPVSVLIDLGGNDTYGYNVVAHRLDKGRFPSDAGGRYNAPGYCRTDADCGVFSGPCVNTACQKACKQDSDCGSDGPCIGTGRKYCKKLKTASGPFSLSSVGRQGSGQLGIGLLFDFGGGDDSYQSLRMSQGFGALGVGVLYDDGGKDKYQCEAGCQGAAMFGIGLLLDRGGDDTYRTYSYAQGFGYARAVGALLDQDGDDRYLADHGNPKVDFLPGQKGDPIYLSAQLPGQANSSFVQGAGFGRRADFSDRRFMSGGLGILRDLKGNDKYVCGVFGQAAGYWFGTGLLADGDGKDTYDGYWYVQGATAHYAVSVMLEGGGDDKYNTILTPRATHTGVGHDFSTSWLIDQSGNDTYVGAGLTLGAGNDNGYGFLIDNGGDDQYSSRNNVSLGVANSPNPDSNGRNTSKVRTFGMFLDAGGKDTYKRPDTKKPANDKTWTQGRSKDGTPRRSLEHGVGVDGVGTSTCSVK